MNYKATFISQSATVNAYALECRECGHEGFVSPKIGFLPTCPRCSNREGIPIAEAIRDYITMELTGDREYTLRRGDDRITMGLILRMYEQLIKEGKGSSIEAVCRLFTTIDKMPLPEIVKEAPKVKEEVVKKKTKTSAADVEEDSIYLLEVIKNKFAEGQVFQNKELATFVSDRMSARQTPSRLRKLVEQGHLLCDDNSPKGYWY